MTPDECSPDQHLVNTYYGQEPSSVYSDKCSVARVKHPQRASQGRLSEDRREATQRGEPDVQCFVSPSPRTARDFKLKEKNKQGKCPESENWLSRQWQMVVNTLEEMPTGIYNNPEKYYMRLSEKAK